MRAKVTSLIAGATAAAAVFLAAPQPCAYG